MYKFTSKQISFEDFGQPLGMKMNPENRWVKKAQHIPWEEIEEKYAKLFGNQKGNVAKPLRLALGACIIQSEYGYSDEEIVKQIQEGPYLQFFCGLNQYKDEPPFDPSLMVHFRKRLTPQILGEINELIIQKAQKKESKNQDEEPKKQSKDNENPANQGTLILDATCAPSDIKYPTDTALLNEAREKSEAIIDQLHQPGKSDKPRTYRRIARKHYKKFVRIRKPNKKKIRQCIRQQLGYLGRNLRTIEKMLKNQENALSKRLTKQLEVLYTVYQQQQTMYKTKTHKVDNRIVSISRPYIRPIVRGKAKTPVEFGAKLDISVAEGYTRLETFSFDNYNESKFLEQAIENYRKRTGHYPQRVLADKIYRNRDNLRYCAKHNIRLSGPALGRPRKDVQSDKKQDYIDICQRVEVERKISLAKRKCGLGWLTTRLAETTASAIALSIVVLNLRKIHCPLFEILLKSLFSFSNNLRFRFFVFIQ